MPGDVRDYGCAAMMRVEVGVEDVFINPGTVRA
jgi:hypothetical protein